MWKRKTPRLCPVCDEFAVPLFRCPHCGAVVDGVGKAVQGSKWTLNSFNPDLDFLNRNPRW